MWATELLRAATCAAAVAGTGLALAQPAVTDQDIRRARERYPMPSEEALRRLPVPASPRVDRLPSPRAGMPLDLEALSRGFDAQLPGAAPGPAAGPSLLVFISFAMPEKTLERLADQASRMQATLVLRGLVDGSLTRTAVRVRTLLGTRRAAIQIDPQAFDRYAVAATPSFVLDWQHYVPLVQRKPGALRNGAPFMDLPEPLARLRQALLKHAGGDRLMAHPTTHLLPTHACGRQRVRSPLT